MNSRSWFSGPGIAAAILLLALAGCETAQEQSLTKSEQAVRQVHLEGMKLGDRATALSRFASVRRVPSASGYEVYEIYNPNAQISTAVASFSGDRLKKLELRYFNGDRIRTLSSAGGWDGLRDYLIAKFGPVSRAGKDVPLETSQPGIKLEYAKFNGEWIFSRQNRKVNYVVLADTSGGVGVVTFSDITPVPRPAAIQTIKPAAPAAARPAGPNPGF